VCYLVVLSTSSDEDLSEYNNELVHFEKEIPDLAEIEKLKYQNKWYLGSKSGCSCTFRHLYSTELGFASPVDWYPEEEDEIDATLQVAKIIRQLVNQGESVDCIDIWEGNKNNQLEIKTINVNLSEVSDEAFRFMENYLFTFSKSHG
jgi:hypothetical protein